MALVDISIDEALGLVDYAPYSICGAQFGPVSCVDGAPDPEIGIAVCGLDELTWEANREDDEEASDSCTSISVKGKNKWYDLTFTWCSRINTLLEAMTGQAELIMDPNDPNKIVGYMDVDDSSIDECCQEPEGCEDEDSYLMIWSQARCDNDPHPDFRFVITVFPHIKWNPSEGGAMEFKNLVSREVTARALKPGEGWGRGPGDILPEGTPADRRWYVIGANEGPPTCSGCTKCGKGPSIIDPTPTPVLAATKTETSTGPYIEGSTVTWDVLVENIGDAEALNVTLADEVTNALGAATGATTYVSGSWADATTTVTIAAGASETQTFSYVVTADDVANGPLTNTATADGTNCDQVTATSSVADLQ